MVERIIGLTRLEPTHRRRVPMLLRESPPDHTTHGQPIRPRRLLVPYHSPRGSRCTSGEWRTRQTCAVESCGLMPAAGAPTARHATGQVTARRYNTDCVRRVTSG